MFNTGWNKKKGFTLAETLIVMSIIGVVSALTIPTIIKSYNKRVLETKLIKFYTEMNQALKLSESENDSLDGWDWPLGHSNPDGNKILYGTRPDAWFKKYLEKYLKKATYVDYRHLGNVWYDSIVIEFDNGTGTMCGEVAVFKVNGIEPFCCLFFPKAEKMYNVRGTTLESENLIPGKDYFVFYIDKDPDTKGLKAFPSTYCTQTSGVKNLPSRGCTYLIQKNNWKIPDDYPIKL